MGVTGREEAKVKTAEAMRQFDLMFLGPSPEEIFGENDYDAVIAQYVWKMVPIRELMEAKPGITRESIILAHQKALGS